MPDNEPSSAPILAGLVTLEAERKHAREQRTEAIRLLSSQWPAIRWTVLFVGMIAGFIGSAWWITIALTQRYDQMSGTLVDHEIRIVKLEPIIARDAMQDARLVAVELSNVEILRMLRQLNQAVADANTAISKLQGFNDGRVPPRPTFIPRDPGGQRGDIAAAEDVHG